MALITQISLQLVFQTITKHLTNKFNHDKIKIIQIERKDFMKNLVELSQQELDAVCGGTEWGGVLLTGAVMSGPWCAPMAALAHNELSLGEVALSTLIAFGIHIAEIAAIYGIGKGLKKLFSSSKKSKETKNI